MANVKNFGLVGVGSNVQFGKAGSKIVLDAGTFQLKAADGTTNTALLAAGITSSAGNVTLTTGNLVLSSDAGTVGIGGATLSKQGAGVLKFDGTGAFVAPVGTLAQRPTGAQGMIRMNAVDAESAGVIEYYNGTEWKTVATGGEAVTSVTGTADRISVNNTDPTDPIIDIASTYVGQESITTLGTIGTGTWNATTVDVAYGGTGSTSFAPGGVLVGDGTDPVVAITGTQFQVLQAGAGGNAVFGAVDLSQSAAVTGVLPSVNGGTGVNNGSSTITLGGSISTTHAFDVVGGPLVLQANPLGSNVSVPVSGTLATTDNVQTVQDELDAVETSLGAGVNGDGTFNDAAFTGFSTTPTSFTNAINQARAAAAAGVQSVAITETGNGITVTDNTVGTAVSFDLELDAGLQALAVKTSTGLMAQTGDNTYESRTLVAPAAGITITDADGVAGNPTFALANDLAALEGLATNGIIVRTGDGTATTRSVTGTAGRITVANGSGVDGSPTVDLDTVTQADTGNFVKVTLDSYGRVTGNTAVTTGDITALVDNTYVNVSGDTMTGNLVMSSGATVTGLPTPSASSDAANKSYVDNLVSGLSWKQSAQVLANANVDITTAPAAIDGVTLASGDRVVLTAQSTDTENGIYVFNGTGSAMTRSADAATYQQLNGSAIFIQQGSYADSAWTQTTELTSFAGQDWVQFSGAGAYTGGTGITVSGTTISANLGAGVTDLPTGEIGLDIVANKAVQLTTTDTAGQLTLVLEGSSLTQSSAGLKVNALGVTNGMLATEGKITLDTDGAGTGDISLGQTLNIFGTSTQGIETTLSGQTVTITAADASSSQKGVASFSDASFVVTSGSVAIKTAGVTNAQLVNSSITFAGTSGSDAVALGETLTFSSTVSGLVSSTVATNGIALDVRNATTTATGVASFSADSFSVTDGAVSIKAGGVTNAQLVNDSVTIGDVELVLGAAASTDLTGLTSLVVDNMTLNGNTIEVTDTNGGLVLMPNGTGSVVIGPVGAGLIESDAATALTVRGNTTLTLEAGTGDVILAVSGTTANKVTVSGPTAAEYATDLADADLANKYYVDQVAASGGAGDIKAVSATLSATGNVGAELPAGATVLSVKVKITSAGAGSLTVGKTGSTSAYMTADENDTETAGLYMAETDVTEATATQVVATISGTMTAKIVVTYQLAE